MKVLIISMFIFFSAQCFAQRDSAISYVEVVDVINSSQSILFTRARDWMENNMKNMKAVLSINDKESGELAGKALIKFEIFYMGKPRNKVPVSIEFNLNVKVKDGKYRYIFSDFDVIEFWDQKSYIGMLRSLNSNQWFGTKKWSLIAYQETKEKVDQQMKALIFSFKTQMNKNDDF